MKIKSGSEWVDDRSGLDVVVESIIAAASEETKVVYKLFDNTGNYLGYNSCTYEAFLVSKTPKAYIYEYRYSKGYEHGVQHMKMQNSMDKYLEVSDKLSLTEDEVDNIIDEAFEEGYVEGYNQHEYEMHQVMSERELDLKAQAYDEGYDQAIDDLIEAGVIGEDEEDYLDEEDSDEGYSEYEFGAVEDDEEDGEEEYCFSKELDRILNSPFVLETDYGSSNKECRKGDYKLVGISGLARSGKDVAGEIILENLGEGWARGAFADIPKEMLFVMGVDTKCANKDGEDEYYQYNIRHLMQSLGTDWGRNIDNDIWIKAFKKKNPTGNFVITDVRMENEADFVRDNGGVIIHVKGRGGIKGNHQSEAGIEIKRGDLLVFNDSDLANFEKEINNICKTLVKRV